MRYLRGASRRMVANALLPGRAEHRSADHVAYGEVRQRHRLDSARRATTNSPRLASRASRAAPAAARGTRVTHLLSGERRQRQVPSNDT